MQQEDVTERPEEEKGALVFSGLDSSSGWQEKVSSIPFYISDS